MIEKWLIFIFKSLYFQKTLVVPVKLTAHKEAIVGMCILTYRGRELDGGAVLYTGVLESAKPASTTD